LSRPTILPIRVPRGEKGLVLTKSPGGKRVVKTRAEAGKKKKRRRRGKGGQKNLEKTGGTCARRRGGRLKSEKVFVWRYVPRESKRMNTQRRLFKKGGDVGSPFGVFPQRPVRGIFE